MENQIILYQTEQGKVTVNVVFQNESFWLTQKAMSELFGVEIPAISKHLKNIFESGELVENSTVSKMEIVQNEGGRNVRRSTDFYNLDAIIAVGYRVNSRQATRFRIHSRANSNERNMGLSTWKNAPKGKIIKNDVRIAKNYLSEDELKDLNLLVNAYLDLAEFQARRHVALRMTDWIERTNKFLESNSLDILPNAGKISHEQAIGKAEHEYEVFRIEQDKRYISNFDEVMKILENKQSQ
ncbi:MAG: virulence RhuM family protein [Dysgonamonadaceae bacterium]|jgi:hypothetical protein|nr:virulence RhuM family protein [Dysgonamonadaceae bacterium]